MTGLSGGVGTRPASGGASQREDRPDRVGVGAIGILAIASNNPPPFVGVVGIVAKSELDAAGLARVSHQDSSRGKGRHQG